MTVIDLTHPLTPDMPVFPGAPQPIVQQTASISEHGCLVHHIAMVTHTGTHADAPAHILTDGATLDGLAVDCYLGRAVVVDAGPAPSGRVEVMHLEPQRERIERVDFVLLHTGWSARWGRDDYFDGFPCLTPDAASWLIDRGIRGFGVDTASVDKMESTEMPVHRRLLGVETFIVENLTNLEALPTAPFLFVALPLKLEGVDGSPVRAVAVLD